MQSKNSILDFYLNRESISKLTKIYQPQRLNRMLSKYLKHVKSVGEMEYYYDQAIKYLKAEPE